jgi:hypothetical protein
MGRPATERGASAGDAADPPELLSRACTTVILFVLVGAGTAMRVQGLTALGFYRDDAWAAMSSRVGLLLP